MAIQPIVGKKYGFYEVVDLDIKLASDKKRMFKVVCSCGKVEFKRATHLESGRCVSCKSCASKRTAKKCPPPVNYKGLGELSGVRFSAIKHCAIRRGMPFNLTIEYLLELFNSQGGLCALTGEPLSLRSTASVDRIDNTKGYEIGNVWWTTKIANRLKNNYSMEELLHLCRKILLIHGNPEPSSANDIKVAEKVQRLMGEESTNNPDTSARPLEIG